VAGKEGRVVKTKLINPDGQRTYAVIFEKGDEVMAGLRRFAEEQELAAGSLTAIGAFSDVVLGFFDRERKEYKRIPVDEQVEVLSLLGDIALKDGRPEVHAHVVLGRADGSALGGHVMEAHVWPTLEVIVEDSPRHLRRRIDKETGLALIDLDAA
jgi:predicted DNA-binding protein with PD1-like motif